MRRLSWLLAAVAMTSCERTPVSRPPPPPKDVLAKVNGRAITDFEVTLRLRTASPHQGAPVELTPEARKGALETIILQEVLAQRAVELGLDQDPTWQEEERKLEAQVNEARRQGLTRLFLAKEVQAKAAVTDADARRYFDDNRARVQTELRVSQVLRKGRASIDQAAAALAQGTPFDEVAGEGFPPQLAAQKPWELPPLAWQQVPVQWWGVVDVLQPGQLSGVIAGANDRFWIIKLLERRDNAAMTFELARAGIGEILQGDKQQAARERTERELRAKARVEYLTPAPAPPPAEER